MRFFNLRVENILWIVERSIMRRVYRILFRLPWLLRQHVFSRGGPVLRNGAWDIMLEAANVIVVQRCVIVILSISLAVALYARP